MKTMYQPYYKELLDTWPIFEANICGAMNISGIFLEKLSISWNGYTLGKFWVDFAKRFIAKTDQSGRPI